MSAVSSGVADRGADLQSSIRANWAQIYHQKGNPGKNAKEAALLANAVYINTFRSTSPFIVIGLDQIRNDADIQNNLGLITGYIPKKKSERYVSHGAVLGEPQWSTLVNDLFMIGAVNSEKEVHTTHSKLPIKSIWDAKRSTWSSFGRELAILKLADYRLIRSDAMNQAIFRPPCGVDLNVLTYKQVCSQLDRIKSEEEARAFILGTQSKSNGNEPLPDSKQHPD